METESSNAIFVASSLNTLQAARATNEIDALVIAYISYSEEVAKNDIAEDLDIEVLYNISQLCLS